MSRIHEKRPQRTPRTPRIEKDDRTIVGISCMGGKDELEQFMVDYQQPEVEVASLFNEPDKWFDYSALESYEEGIYHVSLLFVSNFSLMT